MNRVNVKIFTFISQLLIVIVFVFGIFYKVSDNKNNLIVYNNNFNKMADKTSLLFVEEEKMLNNLDTEEISFLHENEVNDSLKEDKILKSYTGILTGYGPDCAGCGDFNTKKVITSSGYYIADIIDNKIAPAFTITYSDYQYGNVRIVAADKDIPFYSIVRITIPGSEPILSIVLDRGSTVGFENCRSKRGCLTNFDLLFKSEDEAIGKTENVKFELLREGK